MQQLTIDFSAPANQPIKSRMIDALSPPCPIHPPKATGRPCRCVSLLQRTIRGLDSFQQRNTECHCGVETLARRMAVSLRTAQRGLKLAHKWGYITIRPPSQYRTWYYSIDWRRIWHETQESGVPTTASRGHNNSAEGCQQVTLGVTTSHPWGDNMTGVRGDMLSPRIQPEKSNLNQLNSAATNAEDEMRSSESQMQLDSMTREELDRLVDHLPIRDRFDMLKVGDPRQDTRYRPLLLELVQPWRAAALAAKD